MQNAPIKIGTSLTPAKILPMLFIAIIGAFIMRTVEVVTGVTAITGTAIAAEDTKPAEPETAAEETQENTQDDLESSDQNTNQWRDASDEELEYSAVSAELFQDLRQRRESLNAKERSLTTREALIRAAEQELDRKYQELSTLRSNIENLLNQQSEEEQTRIASLVKIYEGMKPKDAARIFDTLDLDVLVAVMGRMSERRLSPILAAMNAERARTITIMLAEQKKLPELPQ